MEAQLGLIGGTMGLLTGFSILSGVEIVYYLLRFFQLHISERILIHLISPQAHHVSQNPLDWGCVCCEEQVWETSDKEKLESSGEEKP